MLPSRKRSPDGASRDWRGGHLIAAYYSFIYPERMKDWVGLVGVPIAVGLPTYMDTRQLQVERRTATFRRSKTDVLPAVPRNQPWNKWGGYKTCVTTRKRCTRCCGAYADNVRFQSRHNIFYYIRSAATSFHVRRRYKMYHNVDVDYDA